MPGRKLYIDFDESVAQGAAIEAQRTGMSLSAWINAIAQRALDGGIEIPDEVDPDEAEVDDAETDEAGPEPAEGAEPENPEPDETDVTAEETIVQTTIFEDTEILEDIDAEDDVEVAIVEVVNITADVDDDEQVDDEVELVGDYLDEIDDFLFGHRTNGNWLDEVVDDADPEPVESELDGDELVWADPSATDET